MAEKKSSMVMLGLVLAVYAAVSCTVLAVVNNFTAPKIERNKAEKINRSMKDFFPEEGLTFESIESLPSSKSSSVKIEGLILTKDDGNITGGAVQVSGATYDTASLLIGLESDGTVRGVKVLSITDSPGFGLKAADSSYRGKNGKTFTEQFTGLDSKERFEAGKNFEAISGATITSEGIAALLNEGSSVLLDYLNKDGGN